MTKQPTIEDLKEIKTYLEHALDELNSIEGNPYEAESDIKDALALINKILRKEKI